MKLATGLVLAGSIAAASAASCGSCKGCLWTYTAGSTCFDAVSAPKVSCDAWGAAYTWCGGGSTPTTTPKPTTTTPKPTTAKPTTKPATTSTTPGKATTATYHIYDGVKPEQTYCNIQWKSINRITAYTNVGTDLVCGDCVEITNSRTNAKLVLQVVDKGGSIFDIAQPAFNTLDTDGAGYQAGHMSITYKKVSCSLL